MLVQTAEIKLQNNNQTDIYHLRTARLTNLSSLSLFSKRMTITIQLLLICSLSFLSFVLDTILIMLHYYKNYVSQNSQTSLIRILWSYFFKLWSYEVRGF